MEKPVLLLVHGYPFDRSMWDAQGASLAGEIRILIPNLPGFGGTSPPAGAPAIEAYADHLAALLDRECVARAMVVGMSMGGYVALAFAERHPARLSGLGLVDTQAIADAGPARAGRRAMIEKIRAEGPDAAAEAMIPRLFAPSRAGDARLAEVVRAGARSAGAAGLSWALEAMAQRPDRSAVLRTLKVPALVVVGAFDAITPPEKARAMSDLIATRDYVEIPGAGHATPIEEPKAVTDALRRLIRVCV